MINSPGWMLMAWVLTGVLTLIAALSYGELAAMLPHAGGMYVYLREAFSPLWGFLYGWTFFMVIQTGTIAAVSVAFARFFSILFPPGLGEPLPDSADPHFARLCDLALHRAIGGDPASSRCSPGPIRAASSTARSCRTFSPARRRWRSSG